MAKPYSLDLLERVVAFESGQSIRQLTNRLVSVLRRLRNGQSASVKRGRLRPNNLAAIVRFG